MARKKRPNGLIWHAMHRGVNGCPIFNDDHDRAYFLGLVANISIDSDIELHSYVLMTNHFHFLLSGRKEEMGLFMRRLDGTYAAAFNRRYDRYGPLYQGRFHAVPIVSPLKVVETSCYIHQNPVPPRLAASAADYRWSSYRFFADGGRGTPDWIDPVLVLERLEELVPGRRNYARLMDSYLGDERDTWLKELNLEAEANQVEK